ncbi:unnamed protein product [Pedinophyceae sp. YPF-701]|nr:unnamed protein product [Pedinophyceae sp. YPF-701]
MGLQLSVAPAPGVTCTPEMQRVIDALGLPATTTSAPPRRDPPALSLPPPGPLLPDPVLPPTGAMGFPVSLPQPSALAMTASPVARPVADAYRPNGESEDRGDADRTEEVRAVKRTRLVWTPELHNRFVAAVNQLGIDNAVPKAILQVMNVDGLTRENVASHLQKYRLTLKRDVDRTSGRNGRSPAPAGSSQSSEPSSSQGGGRGRKRARKPSYGREAEAPPAARFADYAPLLAALQGTHAET